MGFLTTVYLTGLLVSALWLCLSEEITNVHKRFALCVGWPLVLVYGVYEFVMFAIDFAEEVERGHINIRDYLYDLVMGENCGDCDSGHCCAHEHDTDDGENENDDSGGAHRR